MRELVARVVEVFVLWFWAAALLAALWWAYRTPIAAQTRTADEVAPRPVSWTAWLLLAIVVSAFVAFVFWREDFADPDDSFFTTLTLIGDRIRPPVWPEDGRFWPLGYQEFNLIGRLTTTPAGYHAWPVVQLMVVLASAAYLLRALPAFARTGLLVLLLLTPSVALAFSGLVYPERNIAFFLVLLLVCIDRWDRRPSRGSLLGIVVCAQFLLYYKEPLFVLLATLVVGGMLVRRARGAPAMSPVDRVLGALIACFLVLFVASQGAGFNLGYADRFSDAPLVVAYWYVGVDPLLLVFTLVFVCRMVLATMGRAALDLRWDPLAIGALFYAACLIALGLSRPYLMVSVDIVALLYLARLAGSMSPRAGGAARIGMAAVALVISVQSVSQTVLRLAERKGAILAKSALADVVLKESRVSTDTVDLYFPYAGRYQLMELAAYLRYRGLHVERVDDPPSMAERRPIVRLLAPHAFVGGRCEFWRRMRCYERAAAGPAALVVVLPGDKAPVDRPNAALDGRTPVAAVKVLPRLAWMRDVLGRLAAPTPGIAASNVPPQNWLELLVVREPERPAKP